MPVLPQLNFAPRVNTVLHANLAVARRYLDLMLDQHASLDDASETDDFDFE